MGSEKRSDASCLRDLDVLLNRTRIFTRVAPTAAFAKKLQDALTTLTPTIQKMTTTTENEDAQDSIAFAMDAAGFIPAKTLKTGGKKKMKTGGT